MSTAYVTHPWGLVTVSGDDATSFLQALVSQDLEPVGVGESVPCLLLHPQGKLDVAFRAHRTDAGWWCSTEPAAAPRLAASLTRFRIRVAAEIVDRTDDTARGEVVTADAAVAPDLPGVPADCVVHRDVRSDRAVVTVVGPSAAVAAWVEATGLRVGLPEEREAWRIAAGIPRQDVDLDDSVIPQEAFLEADAVSFTKGCFLGQELVCRIDSRGHVNRFIRRLRADAPVRVGDEVVVDGRVVGAITSTATTAEGTAALAFVRREVEPPTPVVVGGVAAVLVVDPEVGSGQ